LGEVGSDLTERVAAIARHNGNGALLASKAAAMAALAEGLCQRAEPMGEMATSAGPVEVYALLCSGTTATEPSGSG
jgi:hypothetical protein